MRSDIVVVTRAVKVTLDEAFFTPAFLKEFSSYMWAADSVEDIIVWLGGLYVSGDVSNLSTFIEGLGDPKAFNLRFEEGPATYDYGKNALQKDYDDEHRDCLDF